MRIGTKETTEEWMSRDDVDGEGDNKLKAYT